MRQSFLHHFAWFHKNAQGKRGQVKREAQTAKKAWGRPSRAASSLIVRPCLSAFSGFLTFLLGLFLLIRAKTEESDTPQDHHDQSSPVKDTKDEGYRLVLKGHFQMDRPQQDGGGSGWIMAFYARRGTGRLLRVSRIIRVAIDASPGVIPVFQVGLGMTHDAVSSQGG